MDLIDLALGSQTEDRYIAFLDQVCARLEFDYAAYASTSPAGGTVRGYVNYPQSWKLHYAEQGFHRIDPTLTETARSIAPVDWSRLKRNTRFQSVFADAQEFGISERGLTIPVRGPYGDIGLFSVTRDCNEDDWDALKTRTLSELQSLAVHLHDKVMGSEELTRVLRNPALSAREKEILQWTAAGKSQQDIGDILSISHRTVEVHLRSGREKLGALTTSQAVGRAIGLGLIYPL